MRIVYCNEEATTEVTVRAGTLLIVFSPDELPAQEAIVQVLKQMYGELPILLEIEKYTTLTPAGSLDS